MTLQIRRNLRFLPAACLVMAVGLFISLAATADPGPALTIGVGRDFFDGPDSRAFLHGSTHTWEGLTTWTPISRPGPGWRNPGTVWMTAAPGCSGSERMSCFMTAQN